MGFLKWNQITNSSTLKYRPTHPQPWWYVLAAHSHLHFCMFFVQVIWPLYSSYYYECPALNNYRCYSHTSCMHPENFLFNFLQHRGFWHKDPYSQSHLLYVLWYPWKGHNNQLSAHKPVTRPMAFCEPWSNNKHQFIYRSWLQSRKDTCPSNGNLTLIRLVSSLTEHPLETWVELVLQEWFERAQGNEYYPLQNIMAM